MCPVVLANSTVYGKIIESSKSFFSEFYIFKWHRCYSPLLVSITSFMALDFVEKTHYFVLKGLHIASVKRLSAGLYLLYDPFLLS